MKLKHLLLLIAIAPFFSAQGQIFWPKEPGEELSTEPWKAGANSAVIDLNNDGVDDIVINEDGFSFDFISVNGVQVGFGAFYDMSFGDFNEDGFLDIVGNYNYTKSSILLSDNTKTFGDADFYSQVDVNNVATRLLTVGDFNNDNNLDVLTLLDALQFSISLGDGLGGFVSTNLGLPASWIGSVAWIIDAVDMNGDNNLDIVSAGRITTGPSTYGITISLGNGDGTFTFVSDYYTSATYYGASAGDETQVVDVDDDGADDIVFENSSGGEIMVLYNNGISAPTEAGTGFYGGDFDILDFNQDLFPDIAYFSSNFNQKQINIILNDGSGNFSAGPSFTNPGDASTFISGDVDGDGSNDIVYYDNNLGNTVISHFDASYAMYEGFIPGLRLIESETYEHMILTDLDFDGYADMVASFSDSLTVVMNQDNVLEFGNPEFVITSADPGPITSADLVGDTYPEIIVGSSGKIEVFDNASGTSLVLGDEFVTNTILDIAAGDMNEDGSPDIVALTSTDILILLNDGSGNLGNPIGYAFASGKHIKLGDINNDEHLDVVASQSTRIFLHPGDGLGAIAVTAFPDYASGREAIEVGDFNNDGIDDILTQSSSAFLTTILGEGGKLMSEMTTMAGGPSLFFKTNLGVGDFNGDGNLDVLSDGRYGQSAMVILGIGDGAFTFNSIDTDVSTSTFGAPGIMAVGDLNFDGKMDAATLANNHVFALLNVFEQAPEPTAQASNVTITDITSSSMTINWDRGNGDGVVVLSSTTGFDPLILEAVLEDFSIAPDFGYTAAYTGPNSSVVLSGRSINTEYTYAVLEYTGGSNIERNYLTTSIPTISDFTLKGDQTISFVYSGNRNFTYDPYDVRNFYYGSASSGLDIFLEVVSGPATITADSLVQLTGLGDVTLRASQPGDLDWNAAAPVEQTFTVIQATQTIGFTLSATTYLSYSNYQLPINTSLGLPISYTIDNGIGSLLTDGDTTWYVWDGEGAVTISAVQAGNTEVAAATPVVRATTVSKNDQTITWQRTMYQPDGSNSLINRYLGEFDAKMRADTLVLNATSSSGLSVDYIVFFGPGYLKGIGEDSKKYIYNGVGDVTITAGALGDEVYNSAMPVNVDFTIIKGDQTISYDATIDGLAVNNYDYDSTVWVRFNASSNSGLAISYSDINGNAAIVGDSAYVRIAGSARIELGQLGDDNWNPATARNVSWVVNRANQTITFEDIYEDFIAKDTTIVLGAVNSTGRDVTYTASSQFLNQTITDGQFVLGGTVQAQALTITAYNQGDENYNQSDFGGYPFITFCIIPAKPVITPSGEGSSQILLTSSNQIDNNVWYQDGSEYTSGVQVGTSEEGSYTLIARSWDGLCPASEESDAISIIITGLKLQGGQKIGVYPNPVESVMNIQLPDSVDPANTQVLITDIAGKTTEMKLNSSRVGSQFEVDMTGFNKGVYLLHIKSADKVFYQKISKQ